MLARNLTAVIAQKLLRRTDRPGRIAANEVLLATPRVRQLIASGQTDLTLAIEAGRDQGMMTMDDCLLQYYRNGFISHETAWLHSREHDRLGSDPEGTPASLSFP